MLRVKFSALTVDSRGVLRFGDAIYSGLAYHVDPEGVVQAIDLVEAGRTTGRSNDWLEVPEGGERVERAGLEMAGDYGPYLWRGASITGVVYSFDSRGVCGVEEIYRHGLPSNEGRRSWYPSGAPWQLLQGEDGSSWFEDGRLQSKSSGDTTLLNLVVRDGRLSGIVAWDQSLIDIETIKRMTFADELLLIGPAIDTALLMTLSDRTALAAVPRLRLIETSVGPEVVALLKTFTGLTTLWLEKNHALRPDDAERIRSARLDWTVHYQERDDED